MGPISKSAAYEAPAFGRALLRASRSVQTANATQDTARKTNYFAVGITNSAPLPMLSGQRCMIDFCFV